MNQTEASALATRLAEKMVRNDKFQIEWWNQTIDMLPPNAAVVAAELLPLLQSQEAAEDSSVGTSSNPISFKIRTLQSENAALRALVGRMRMALDIAVGYVPELTASKAEVENAIEEADKVVN